MRCIQLLCLVLVYKRIEHQQKTLCSPIQAKITSPVTKSLWHINKKTKEERSVRRESERRRREPQLQV